MSLVLIASVTIAVVGVVAGFCFYGTAKWKFNDRARKEYVAQCVEIFKKGRDSDCSDVAIFVATNPDGLCSKRLEEVIWKIENIENERYSEPKQKITLVRSRSEKS